VAAVTEPVSSSGPASGAGRRKRTSRPAVTQGSGRPSAPTQPRRSASLNTAAALWQSSTVLRMPPLTEPNPLPCSAHGTNVAVTPSPSA
jgi:hypothetical protein